MCFVNINELLARRAGIRPTMVKEALSEVIESYQDIDNITINDVGFKDRLNLILEEIKVIISQRNHSYGGPCTVFADTSSIMNILYKSAHSKIEFEDVTAFDVVYTHIVEKLIRDVAMWKTAINDNRLPHSDDSLLDVIGYTLILIDMKRNLFSKVGDLVMQELMPMRNNDIKANDE